MKDTDNSSPLAFPRTASFIPELVVSGTTSVMFSRLVSAATGWEPLTEYWFVWGFVPMGVISLCGAVGLAYFFESTFWRRVAAASAALWVVAIVAECTRVLTES